MAVKPGRLSRDLLAEADGLGRVRLLLGLGLGLGLAGVDDREQGDDKSHQEDCELSELHDCREKMGVCVRRKEGSVE